MIGIELTLRYPLRNSSLSGLSPRQTYLQDR